MVELVSCGRHAGTGCCPRGVGVRTLCSAPHPKQYVGAQRAVGLTLAADNDVPVGVLEVSGADTAGLSLWRQSLTCFCPSTDVCQFLPHQNVVHVVLYTL